MTTEEKVKKLVNLNRLEGYIRAHRDMSAIIGESIERFRDCSVEEVLTALARALHDQATAAAEGLEVDRKNFENELEKEGIQK